MRYVHRLGYEETTQSDSTSFLLARKAGGYLSLGLPNISRYQGFTTILPWNNSWELAKALENITIDEHTDTISLLSDGVERAGKKALERFSMYEGAFSYELSGYSGQVKITLDMRFIHDFELWGREYSIQDMPGGHVITYKCPRYSFCLAVIGAKGVFKPVWKPIEYTYDKSRSAKADFSVCECLTYDCVERLSLRFGVGWTPAAAMVQANNTNAQNHDLSHEDKDASLQAALADLDGVICKLPSLDSAILAGYPWFYQVYTRDEAISCGALIRLGRHDLAKKILLRQLQYLQSDGRIDNRFPSSGLASADGVGWTFLRLHELFLEGALNLDEQKEVHQALDKSLKGLERHMHVGLIHNGWKETWMDTTGGSNDGRPGARIEIQALTLRMHKFMTELTSALHQDNTMQKKREEEFARHVRERFFDQNSGILADGFTDQADRTIRPNIFLAAYAYPQLLSHDEWQRAHRQALKKLWLDWGGLATIDKDNHLFTSQYTGENDKSYHRGDSWYFLCNIAAMVLREAGFVSEADKIFSASKEQLLGFGIPGHAAETSSASHLEGAGCFSQAWSAATFIELWLARKH